MFHQKWEIWVDGRQILTTAGGGSSAQAMLEKVKRAWPGCKIEVVAVFK